jgi:hypothetical protein
MTSTFKQNSRFSALIDNEPVTTRNVKPVYREEYSDSPQRNRYTNRFSKEQPDKNNDDLRLKKDEASRLELSDLNFPSIVQPNINIVTTNIHYNELFNTNNKDNTKIVVVDPDTENLQPGWVSIRRDTSTGKTIWKQNKRSLTKSPLEKSENEIASDIGFALVELYEKRTNEYIDMWGYDEWEKTFRFSNYDYKYFDRLDELEEEELAYEAVITQEELDEIDYYNDSFERWK